LSFFKDGEFAAARGEFPSAVKPCRVSVLQVFSDSPGHQQARARAACQSRRD
jgi:hypothetical protein